MRKRHVYLTSEVFHLWANRAPVAGDIRNAGGNVFTSADGARVFSYGTHYTIGQWVTHPKTGATLLLLNGRHYSNTTAKHCREAWHALPRDARDAAVTVLFLSGDGFAGLVADAASLVADGADSLERSHTARTNRPYLIRHARAQFAAAVRLLTFAGDARRAADVPAIPDGEPDKETIRAILQALRGREYLAKAREHLERARGRATEAGNPHAWGGTDGRIDAARMATQNADTSAGLYRKAGKKPAPECARIVASMRALLATLEPVAAAEHRAQLARDCANASGSVAAYFRSRHGRAVTRGRDTRVHLHAWEWEHVTGTNRRASAHGLPDEWRPLAARYHAARRVDALREVCDDTSHNDARAIMRALSAVSDALAHRPAAVVHWERIARAAAEAANVRAAAEYARLAREHAESIAQWRAGASVRLGYSVPTMARIRGDVVETSRGASVPLEHAARLVRIAQRVAQRGGADWVPGTGPRVGHYQVQSIGADLSAVIGCHEFSAEESARIVADIIAHPCYAGATADGVTQ